MQACRVVGVLENVTLTVETAEENRAAGQDITVAFDGSQGDFASASNLESVFLKDGDEEPRQLHTMSEIGDSGNDWYELSGDRTKITLRGGLFKHEADYTLTVKAQYYGERSVTFHVAAAEVSGTKKTPTAVSVTDGSDFFDGAYKIVRFSMKEADAELAEGETFDEDAQIAKWLGGLSDYSVKVGDREYRKGTLSVSGDTFLTAQDDVQGGAYKFLKLGTDGFTENGDTVITIQSEGYLPYTFTVKADGAIAGPQTPGEDPEGPDVPDEPDVPDDPEVNKSAPSGITISNSGNAVREDYLDLTGGSDFTEWISHVTNVKINDTMLTEVTEPGKFADYYSGKASKPDTYYRGDTELKVTLSNAVKDGENKVVITAEGYNDLKLVLTKYDPYVYGNYSFKLEAASPEDGSAETESVADTDGVLSDMEQDVNYSGNLFGDESAVPEAADGIVPEATVEEAGPDVGDSIVSSDDQTVVSENPDAEEEAAGLSGADDNGTDSSQIMEG